MSSRPDQQPGSIASNVWGADLSDEERERLASFLEDLAEDPFLRMVAARSLNWMQIPDGAHVLEVGCGSGVLLTAMARMVGPKGRVTGIDHAPGMLEEARATIAAAGVGEIVNLVEGDARQLPFPDSSFDAAHIERVLMHVPEADAVLREMARVVRPGGWIVAAEPDYGAIRTDHPDHETLAIINREAIAVFSNPTIGIELRRRMVESGLTDARVEVFVETETDLHPMSKAALEGAAQRAVAAGALNEARADAAIGYIVEANARGTYASYDHMVVTVGRVPVQ